MANLPSVYYNHGRDSWQFSAFWANIEHHICCVNVMNLLKISTYFDYDHGFSHFKFWTYTVLAAEYKNLNGCLNCNNKHRAHERGPEWSMTPTFCKVKSFSEKLIKVLSRCRFSSIRNTKIFFHLFSYFYFSASTNTKNVRINISIVKFRYCAQAATQV